MDVIQAITERSSIRNYTGRDIQEDDLMEILNSAREAPSAKNLQPWELVVVTDTRKKKRLVSICHNQGFVEDAGALIVGIIHDEKWADVDLAIALDHISLAAVEKGLGTCWIGSFDHERMKEELDVPDRYEVKVCMTIGYPDEEGGATTKKSVDELVHWESYKG